MSEHDLQARPVCRRGPDPVEAHLTIMSVALAVSRWVETAAVWTIRKFVRAGSLLRTIELRGRARALAAAGILPDDGYGALDRIRQRSHARSWWPGTGY